MKNLEPWARTFVILGLTGMLLGAVDPLEGSLLILPTTGLAAAGSFLGKCRHYRMSCWAVMLVAVGVAALFGLSALGGVGGQSGHSIWWLMVVIPYPIGWLLGLSAAVFNLMELSNRISRQAPA